MGFAQYLESPTMLWTVTAIWNPQGQAAGAEEFLLMPAERLDTGYSAGLQQKASSFGGGHGITAGGLQYIMSDGVQDEIIGVLEEGSACSLEAERRINLIRRGEGLKGQKVRSLHRASRDSTLQRYRLQRKPVIASNEAAVKRYKKDHTMNARALAI